MFALGYYAGCRASDVCWFRLDQIHHFTKKSGTITVGYKRSQLRTLDLTNEARRSLQAYVEEERKHIQTDCPFVFLSQRAHTMTKRAGDHPRRLTKGGLHAWLHTMTERATQSQWEHIADITFHESRARFRPSVACCWLYPRRGGSFSRPCHQERNTSGRNHRPLHPTQPCPDEAQT